MTESDLKNVMARLERVEKQNTRFKIFIGLLIGVLGLGVLVAATPEEANNPNAEIEVHDVVKAKNFIVVDDEGIQRIIMGTLGDPYSFIRFLDKDSNTLIRISTTRMTDNHAARITLNGSDNNNVSLGIDKNNIQYLTFQDKDEYDKINIRSNKLLTQFSLNSNPSDIDGDLESSIVLSLIANRPIMQLNQHKKVNMERLEKRVESLDKDNKKNNKADEILEIMQEAGFNDNSFQLGVDENGCVMTLHNKTGESIITLQADEYGNGVVGAWNRKGKGRTLQPGN